MNLNKQKGITLISLVITIIILIILAGVALHLVLGENGILQRAKQAREETQNAQIKEDNILDEYTNFINYHADAIQMLSADMISFTPKNSNWHVENVKEALDYLYNN